MWISGKAQIEQNIAYCYIWVMGCGILVSLLRTLSLSVGLYIYTVILFLVKLRLYYRINKLYVKKGVK